MKTPSLLRMSASLLPPWQMSRCSAMLTLWLLFGVGLAGNVSGQGVTDTDGDGMPDAWEASMGLDSNDAADAWTDLDADRVPNVWEYLKNTSAANAASVPAADATVDSTLPQEPSASRYATWQAAYDALQGGFSVVVVKRGHYAATLITTGGKKVLWLCEAGGDRSSGYEGVVLAGAASSGFHVTADAVIDGAIFDGGSSLTSPLDAPAITADADGGATPRLKLVNVLFRDWHVGTSELAPLPGALHALDADIELVHCTFWRCASWDASSSEGGPLLLQDGGELLAGNCIFWDDLATPSLAVETDGSPVFEACLVQGTAFGSMNVAPGLTAEGRLSASSTPCLGMGETFELSVDLDGEARDLAEPDIGADEWTDSDEDGLADAWENFWFGSLAQAASGDPDGDSINNLAEAQSGSPPLPDLDADGLADAAEWTFFGSLLQSYSGDYDGDGVGNGSEIALNANPAVAATAASPGDLGFHVSTASY